MDIAIFCQFDSTGSTFCLPNVALISMYPDLLPLYPFFQGTGRLLEIPHIQVFFTWVIHQCCAISIRQSHRTRRRSECRLYLSCTAPGGKLLFVACQAWLRFFVIKWFQFSLKVRFSRTPAIFQVVPWCLASSKATEISRPNTCLICWWNVGHQNWLSWMIRRLMHSFCSLARKIISVTLVIILIRLMSYWFSGTAWFLRSYGPSPLWRISRW